MGEPCLPLLFFWILTLNLDLKTEKASSRRETGVRSIQRNNLKPMEHRLYTL